MQIRDNIIVNEIGIVVMDFGFKTGQPVNMGITIINNTITNTLKDSMLVVSAGQVVVANNIALNPYCTSSQPTTSSYSFAPYFTPYVMVNITGLTFTNNSIVQNSSCAYPQINYGAPIQIIGSTGVVMSQEGPFPVLDTLASGQSLVSPGKIFSANGQFFIAPQFDGNLVLYNTSTFQIAQQGSVWTSNTYTPSSPTPSRKSLNMLPVRAQPPQQRMHVLHA